MGFSARLSITGGFQHASGPLRASRRIPGPGAPAGDMALDDGTGANQANFAYCVALSVPATTMVAYDLKGGGGELDVLNVAMAATAVKYVLLEITTPGASTSLRFGPQNQTDAAQLWFPGVGATDYVTVKDTLVMADPRAGWAIGASTKKLCVYNPGAATVAGYLWVFGVK